MNELTTWWTCLGCRENPVRGPHDRCSLCVAMANGHDEHCEAEWIAAAGGYTGCGCAYRRGEVRP